MQPVIVGIDPGITCAFAVLDFDFNVLKVLSKRNFSLSELISEVYKAGNPIIVGTDKKEIPSFIKDFSQKTGAKIHLTRYDTKKGEKKNIVKENGFLGHVKNVHETDALASAIYAFNDFRPLLNKINKFVKMNNKESIKQSLIVKMIVEEKSLRNAVEDIEFKPVKKERSDKLRQQVAPRVLTKEEKEIRLLKIAIKNQKDELRELKEENLLLKSKRVDIDKELVRILSNKEKRALILKEQNRILSESLEYKERIIKKLNEFILKSQTSVLIKKLDNLGVEELEKKEKILGIKDGDILLVEDASIASSKVIQEMIGKIKIIIFNKKTNSFLQEKFLMLDKKNLEIFETKHFALVSKQQLESEVNKAVQVSKKEKTFISDILQEYKRERLKDIL